MAEPVADAGGAGTITVYLLDDHELTRRGIRELLLSAGGIEIVGESGLAETAARAIPALGPDDPRRPASGRIRHRGVPRHPLARDPAGGWRAQPGPR